MATLKDLNKVPNQEIAALLNLAEHASSALSADNNTIRIRCRIPKTAPGQKSQPLFYRIRRRLNGFTVVLDVVQLLPTEGNTEPTPDSPEISLYYNVAWDDEGPVQAAWNDALLRGSDADDLTTNTLRAGAYRALRLLGVVSDERSA